MIIVTTDDYWKTILNDLTQYGQIETENDDFNKRSNAIWKVLENTLIKNDGEKVIQEWEKTLLLQISEEATLFDRKCSILKVLSEKSYIPFSLINRILTNICGEGNFEMSYDNDAQKVTVFLCYDVLHLRGTVDSLIERVVPQSLEFEITELPFGYTRVEYLDGAGGPYIVCEPERIKNPFEMHAVFYAGGVRMGNNFCGQQANGNNPRWFFYSYSGAGHLGFNITQKSSNEVKSTNCYLTGEVKKYEASYKNGIYTDPNGETVEWGDLKESSGTVDMIMFDRWNDYGNKICSVYAKTGEKVHHYVAALDNTGAPCMFDLVSRKAFYNSGSGDFIVGIETQQQLDNLLVSFPNYTGQAIEKLQINLAEALQTEENEARLAEAFAQNSTMPAMLSLDMEYTAPKFYAKLTEHGIHRLYHVPTYYIGTMDEYATENDFKELIEPPMPQVGYWKPQWNETDTQLILEWVETEPPTEELS